MPKTVEVKVAGFAELQKAMRALSLDVRNQHLSAAIGAGATVIRKEAVQLAPKDTGTLRRAIYRVRDAKAPDGESRWIVGVRRGKKYQSRTLTSKRGKQFTTKNRDAYYWAWIEFGHIARGPGQRIKGGTRTKQSKRDQLRTQGHFVPARPFMRPAFERRKEDAVEAIKKRLGADLARSVPGFKPA